MNISSISKWHVSKFPLATSVMQINKYNEERKEYLNAKDIDNMWEELADLVITVISLVRFEITKSMHEDLMCFYYHSLPTVSRLRLDKEINKKIAKINQLEYVFMDSEYQRDKKNTVVIPNYKNSTIKKISIDLKNKKK